jgi:hypothetical protein
MECPEKRLESYHRVLRMAPRSVAKRRHSGPSAYAARSFWSPKKGVSERAQKSPSQSMPSSSWDVNSPSHSELPSASPPRDVRLRRQFRPFDTPPTAHRTIPRTRVVPLPCSFADPPPLRPTPSPSPFTGAPRPPKAIPFATATQSSWSVACTGCCIALKEPSAAPARSFATRRLEEMCAEFLRPADFSPQSA